MRSYLVPLSEAGELPEAGEADLRYAGQSFELTLPLQPDLAAAFHRAHEEQYGFAEPEREIELVAVRTAEIRPGPELDLPRGEGDDGRRPAVRRARGRHLLDSPRVGGG